MPTTLLHTINLIRLYLSLISDTVNPYMIHNTGLRLMEEAKLTFY
jgi:hypothetical protein